MKKIILCLAFACFSTHVHAVHLSTNDVGQVLIFPYFTVNGGFDTLITLTNTTGQAKAVRVRFREAANSREVYNFNLYLGPHDVWVGALVKGDEGENFHTKLVNPDLSCTVPIINNQNNLFYKSEYTGVLSDSYGDSVERLHEGYIEVIEMGVVTGVSGLATGTDNGQQDCQKLENAWLSDSDNSYWFNDSNIDMLPPVGGITGNVALINIQEGIAISQEASVIDDFSDGILHSSPSVSTPSLADGKTTSEVVIEGVLYEMQWSTGIDALSSLLMIESYKNDYVLTDTINAATQWVMTMPTRQFYTDPNYRLSSSTALFGQSSCEEGEISIYDRNGYQEPEPLPCSSIGCPHYEIVDLCFATNTAVIESQNDSTLDSIFTSNNGISNGENNGYLLTESDTGWIKNTFIQSMVSDNGFTVHGLPIIGFSTQKYVNGSIIGGVLANYAGNFKHKTTSKITEQAAAESSSAMSVSSDGKGQVLLYPFYTVRNGINTLITVVNPTPEVKAIKVRFHEGKNSRDVLNFNLYIGPNDEWTAALIGIDSMIDGHSGEASVKLITNDTSCVVPNINGQEFSPFGFTGDLDDGLGNNKNRVQEGFLEVIEMGSVIGDDAIAATLSGGLPASCSTLVDNWSNNGKWLGDPTINMQAPDGKTGISGTISLIDIASGVDMTFNAIAIENYSTLLSHTNPGSLLPNLSTGNQKATLIDTKEGFIYTTWNSSIDAVSALFMQGQISNDFIVSAGVGAQTEWVNTFPTKQFYTDPRYSGSSTSLPPFSEVVLDEFGTCDKHRFIAYNREQEVNAFTPSGIVGSPLPPNFSNYPEDCWSVNVSDINMGTDTNSMFDSNLFINDLFNDSQYSSRRDLPFDSGWMEIDFIDENIVTPEKLIGSGGDGITHVIYGKPVIGFVAQKFVNGVLGNKTLANYGVINKNKGVRKIEVNLPIKLE